jgi:hypothetical protein
VVKSVSLRRKEAPMVARVNRQILLKSRPEGVPSLDNFVLRQSSVPEPGDGEVLMRTRKRDERGKRLFAASEARAAGRRRCWERPATFRVQSTPAVRPRGRSTDH